MMKYSPPICHFVLFPLCHMLFAAGGVMFGGTIAALANGASHVTEACGKGISGCGASQHWAIWSVAIAVLCYALITSGLFFAYALVGNSLFLENTYRHTAAYRRGPKTPLEVAALDVERWIRSNLTALKESRRFKQWLVLILLLGLIGIGVGAAIGGAAGGFLYGNFITGMGAANGVPLIGWLVGMPFGTVLAGVSALLFGILSGVISALMLPRQLRSSRRL